MGCTLLGSDSARLNAHAPCARYSNHIRDLTYRMRGFYTVQTQADFDAWLADQAAQLTPAAP